MRRDERLMPRTSRDIERVSRHQTLMDARRDQHPVGREMVPEEESITKCMILKRKLFLFNMQNDGPVDGPRQDFVELFEC